MILFTSLLAISIIAALIVIICSKSKEEVKEQNQSLCSYYRTRLVINTVTKFLMLFLIVSKILEVKYIQNYNIDLLEEESLISEAEKTMEAIFGISFSFILLVYSYTIVQFDNDMTLTYKRYIKLIISNFILMAYNFNIFKSRTFVAYTIYFIFASINIVIVLLELSMTIYTYHIFFSVLSNIY
jgi:hypothetical protein